MRTYLVEAVQVVTHVFEVSASSQSAAMKVVDKRKAKVERVKRAGTKFGPLVVSNATPKKEAKK